MIYYLSEQYLSVYLGEHHYAEYADYSPMSRLLEG
jgi:hypothetical protein